MWDQLLSSLPFEGLSELCTACQLRGSRHLGEGSPRLGPAHLSFREAEAVRQLLPLGAHHVVVFLEGVFQPQKLGRGKGGSDPLRLSGQRVVQKEALGACVVPCGGHSRSPVRGNSPGPAARFSGDGLAGHRAQGLCVAPAGTGTYGVARRGYWPRCPARAAGLCLCGTPRCAVPRLLTSADFTATLARGPRHLWTGRLGHRRGRPERPANWSPRPKETAFSSF